MRSELADKPACARIFLEQPRAHAPVFDDLGEISRHTLRQGFELGKRGMFGSCDQQVEIADQHIGREAVAHFVVRNHDAPALDSRSIRTKNDRHAVLPREDARNLAERGLELEPPGVARRVHRAHPAGAM
jgi:hypothetical protein